VSTSCIKPYLKSVPLLILIIGLVSSLCGCTGRAYSPAPVADLGPAARTQIVATLDQPMEAGRNTIWCASFTAAWKRLQYDLAGGTVQLDGAQELVASLNVAPDPAKDVPADSLYAVAGLYTDAFLQQIQQEVSKRFAGSAAPQLPPPAPETAIAYARLELKAKFPVPYFDQQTPFQWKDASGAAHDVHAFGIFSDSPDKLLAQPRVLFDHPQHADQPREFALDLNDPSQPIEIMVAKVSRRATLAETLAAIDDARRQDTPKQLEYASILVVPEMAWRVSHEFEQLKDRRITSGPLAEGKIAEARQDIDFRLDRSGVELRSESFVITLLGRTPVYEFDGPFLLVLRQRTSEKPFLVMWVENDELLRPFASAADATR
jgi:hypothetical protein